jgi:hypothetical protein
MDGTIPFLQLFVDAAKFLVYKLHSFILRIAEVLQDMCIEDKNRQDLVALTQCLVKGVIVIQSQVPSKPEYRMGISDHDFNWEILTNSPDISL